MIRNGYRVLAWQPEGQYGIREGITARTLHRLLNWWHSSDWLYEQCRLDELACGIPPNEVSPPWTLTWWCCLPDRMIHKFCTNIDNLQPQN